MKKILIINSNYYKKISSNLLVNAVRKLILAKIKVRVLEVPGIFEIPIAIRKNIKKYDGFVALGCVIKGETPHFDYISRSTFDALMKLSVDHRKPIGNGIITALNQRQVIQRCGRPDLPLNKRKKGKGLEAAKAVIEVLKNDSKN